MSEGKDNDFSSESDSPSLPQMDATQMSSLDDRLKGKRPAIGLSSKLLLLTILFVMLSEVLIFVPSISKFRVDWLVRKLEVAEVAALIYSRASNDLMDEKLEADLLERLDVQTLAMRSDGQRPPAGDGRYARPDQS